MNLFSYLQWLLVAAYQRIKSPIKKLVEKERPVYLIIALVLLCCLIVPTPENEGVKRWVFILSEVVAIVVTLFHLIVLLLKKLVEPVPKFTEPNINRWKKELRTSSKQDGDSKLFGFTIRRACKSDAVRVALLLREAFSCRAIDYKRRIEICQIMISRYPGSILLIFKDDELAGCSIALPLSKSCVTRYLSGKLRESEILASHIPTRGQARNGSLFILVSAIYLRKKYQNTEAREVQWFSQNHAAIEP